jgi:hypothetical protein
LTIEARHVEGPFQRLDTRWRLCRSAPVEVHFLIDFAFKEHVAFSAVAGVAFRLRRIKMAEPSSARACFTARLTDRLTPLEIWATFSRFDASHAYFRRAVSPEWHS